MMLKALESYDPNLGVIAPSYRANMILIADVQGKCTSAKEPYLSAQKSCISVKEPISAKEPVSLRLRAVPETLQIRDIADAAGKCTPAKEPYRSAKKPYIFAKEPCMSTKERCMSKMAGCYHTNMTVLVNVLYIRKKALYIRQ